MYAGLNDSYQWNQLNMNNAVMSKIQDILAKGERVTLDRIPTAILALKNKIKSPLTTKILTRIQDGDIVLLYAPTVKVPVYLPYIISKNGNKLSGMIFLNNMVSNSAQGDGEISVDARKLKVSLESCYITMCLNEMGNSPKTRSTTILRAGSRIYSSIMTECINRKHSIKMDTSIYNSLIYIMSRYYIGTMIGCRDSMDAETMRNYCLYNCRNVDILSMEKIINQFEEKDFDNIATLIDKIKIVPEFQKRLGNITVTNFLESYINMYNATMLLGLEVFSYFLYNIISVNDSTYINNYPVLKNLVGDDGRKLYADLVVAIGNL